MTWPEERAAGVGLADRTTWFHILDWAIVAWSPRRGAPDLDVDLYPLIDRTLATERRPEATEEADHARQEQVRV